MKKNIFVIIFFLFFLVGCQTTVKEVVVINIDNITMSSEKEELIYEIKIVNEKLITDENYIKQFNYYYSFENNDKTNLLKEAKNVIENKQLIHTISFTSLNYDSDLSIIFELELAESGFVYSKVNTINVSTLAKETYLKDNTNQIAKNICEGNLIYVIDLTIDVSKTEQSGEEEKYRYTYSNPVYNKVTIVITLKDKYLFANDFILKVNGDVIDSKYYVFDGGVLTCKYSDPNWSEII